MRIYRNFVEATNEIKRELAEMSIVVHPKTYQDKNIEYDPRYDTFELQNYIYCVTSPNPDDLTPTRPWVDLELAERLEGGGMCNPGEAWKTRPEVWTQFLQCPPDCIGERIDKKYCEPLPCSYSRFSYTYDERMFFQIREIISEIKSNPNSRQLYMSIWDPISDIKNLGGKARIPCSLGYLFQVRRDQLNMTYLMRSSDFVTHWQNDVYLALKLQEYIAERTGYPVGMFTHYMGSLHVFRKDVEGVF